MLHNYELNRTLLVKRLIIKMYFNGGSMITSVSLLMTFRLSFFQSLNNYQSNSYVDQFRYLGSLVTMNALTAAKKLDHVLLWRRMLLPSILI